MIVALVTDSNSGPLSADANCNDGFAFVALVPIPANEVILFTENEFTGGVFTTGEGTLSWTNGGSVLPAGTVVQVTTNASTSGNCLTPSASTGAVAFVGGDEWALATSNEEIYVFQGSLAAPTVISALLTNNSGTGGQTNNPPASISGFIVDFTGVDIDADLGIYTGGLIFPSKAAAAAAIVNVANNWTLEDGPDPNECCDADGVDYPADIPAMFTIGIACVDPTIVLTQSPAGPHCPTASVNILINGGVDPGTTAYTLRTGSAAGPIVSGPLVTSQFTINIPATTTYFVTTPNCTGGTVSASITITTTGTAAMAGPDQLNVIGTSTTLAGSNPSPGTGMWSQTSGDGNGMFGNASSPTSTFSGTSGVTYTLQWEVTNPPCATTTDEVMVSFSAPSTLTIGDLAFTGYRSDNPDTFSFVIFRDIGTGTVINFTDNGWLATGGFRTGEGVIAVTFNGMALCGNQFFVTGGNFLNYDGTSAGTVSNTSGTLDLAISGDQLFAFQGTFANPTLLAAIHMNGAWDGDALDASTSAQPQIFIDNPGTSLAITTEVDNGVFVCSNLPPNSSISGNRAAVNTASNWNTSNETTTGIPPVDCISGFSCCEDPVITNLLYSPDPVCPGAGNNITLTITGSLNDATEWVVYTDSCGETEVLRSSDPIIDLGSLATVGTTTIFVRGEGGCVPAGKACTSLNILVEETVTALCVAPFTVQLDALGMATITTDDVDNGSTACTTPTLSIDVSSFTCAEVGPNLITLTVEDQNTNSATCSVTVTVADGIAPQALCQDIDVFLDANGMASIVPADVDGGSNDNCGISSSTVAPDVFDCDDITGNPNMVTLTVFDAAGNFASCAALVTVRDTIRPVFTCQDITVSLDASGMFSIPSANFIRDNIQTNFQDNCSSSSVEFGITVDSWNCSNIGDNSTTIFARDGNGNETPCTITVTVTDPLMTCNQPPVAVCQPVTVNADANCEATVTAMAFDGGSTDPDMDPLSFSVSPAGPYALGTTPVILTVSDGMAMSQCMTTVMVVDNTPPTITCPATQTLALGASCTATLPNYTTLATTGDNCGVQGVTQSPAAGTTVSNSGNMTVTLTVTDINGLTNTCTFTVSKVDNTTPSISCPATQTLALGASCTATLPNYTTLATTGDNCGVQGVTQSPAAGTTVSNSGNMTVTLTVTDINGLTNTCTFTVSKVDNTPPSISCPATQTLVLGANCTASLPNYTGLASSSDNCAGLEGVTQSPAAGTIVSGAGNMTVTLRVTDANGLMNSCNFSVTKLDNIAPAVQCSNQTINFNGETSIPLDPDDLVDATDNCGIQSISLLPNSISSSQVGQTVPVVVTVTDVNGNSATCTSQITVGGLPSGWSQNANGVGCADGNNIDYNTSNGTWTATSTNCYYTPPYTSDASAFAQYSLCGNGSITAQVTGISGTSLGWAGVVMRETNAPGAKKAQLTTNMSNFSRREFRTTTNGASFPQQFPSQNRRWLRIVRSGNQFAMYVSPNGVNWAFAGAQTIQMNSCIQIGLVVSNYSSNSTVTANFANVSVFESNLPVMANSDDLASFDFIEDRQSVRDVKVYPNPTSGQLNIALTGYEGRPVTLEVYNTMGQMLYVKEVDEVQNADEIIDLSSVASGMYLIRVSSDGLPAEMKRVTVAR